MIRSFIDTDLYKLTMCQAVHKLYPYAEVEYKLIFRDPVTFSQDHSIANELRSFQYLRLKKDELEYLKSLNLFSPVFLEFLGSYEFDLNELDFSYEKGALELTIKGPWYRTILWEVHLLSVISESYFEDKQPAFYQKRFLNNIMKVAKLTDNEVTFLEFGTRRRFSFKIQEEFIKEAKNSSYFQGTSNMYLAMKHRVPCAGTYAHEWVMYHGALDGGVNADYGAMKAWTDLYQGKLAIALSDTYGSGMFLDSFDEFNWGDVDPEFFRKFDGVRHDSGDPFEFAEKLINYYEYREDDPKTKTILFSDSLTTDKAVELNNRFKDRINCKFGIGTHFTNDVGVKPLNMVIKPTKFRKDSDSPWRGAVKLSDVEGKETGTSEDIERYKQEIKEYFG